MFRSQLSIKVLHEYMGYVPSDKEESGAISCSVCGSILILARLDAFIATAVTSLREDGSETVEGHRQKLYQETFRSYLPKAFQQIAASIRTFVQLWCPSELELSSLSLSESGPNDSGMTREATIEVSVPSLQQRLVALSYIWFNRYITSYLGNVHDCYIVEYNAESESIVMLSCSAGAELSQLNDSELFACGH